MDDQEDDRSSKVEDQELEIKTSETELIFNNLIEDFKNCPQQ